MSFVKMLQLIICGCLKNIIMLNLAIAISNKKSVAKEFVSDNIRLIKILENIYFNPVCHFACRILKKRFFLKKKQFLVWTFLKYFKRRHRRPHNNVCTV